MAGIQIGCALFSTICGIYCAYHGNAQGVFGNAFAAAVNLSCGINSLRKPAAR